MQKEASWHDENGRNQSTSLPGILEESIKPSRSARRGHTVDWLLELVAGKLLSGLLWSNMLRVDDDYELEEPTRSGLDTEYFMFGVHRT